MLQRGDCVKMDTSYGDARPGWFIFWRVRRSIGQAHAGGYMECHRFETRCDGMRVMNPAECVRTELLVKLPRVELDEWTREWERWQVAATEMWNVE